MGKYDFDLELYENNPLAWIAGRVTESSDVLEFGPADGRLTRYLKENKGCRIDIVEIDAESGKKAAAYARHAFVGEEEGDIENYRWLSGEDRYDFIIFADVLEHLLHPWEVLKRCKKVIKPEGLILVSIPNIAHNSVIIDLMNDRFTYHPTGLLDNTHIRFFTRESFVQMVQKEGWAVTEEMSALIRVGENEIQNTYADVPKEVFKFLAARPAGNIYQYMFALTPSAAYLTGNCSRLVSLDAASFYQTEIQFQHDGVFDYQKSIVCQVNPYGGEIRLDIDVLPGSREALLYPLSCNCVLKLKSFTADGRPVEAGHNGVSIGERLYFVSEKPRFWFRLQEGTKRLHLEFLVCKYDFEDETYTELFNTLLYEQQHIRQVCKDYEDVLRQKEEELCASRLAAESAVQQTRRGPVYRLARRVYRGLKKNLKKAPLPEKLKNRVDIYRQRDCYPKAEGTILPVTAVIPNYNYARYLDERIDSILFQTYPVSEIIILDDCSSDNSIKLIEKRIRENDTGIPISLLANETNSGSVFAQWQKAFEVSKTEFVWIAEADDSCDPRFLQTVMQGFKEEGVVLSYCESLTMDEDNILLMGDLRPWIDLFSTGKWDRDYIKDGPAEVAETMCINNTIANVSSTVIRNGDYRRILEEAKEYKLAGDWYTYMNLLKNGRIAYFKDSFNYHRMQTQGLTLSTSPQKEFEEIVRLQEFALNHFDVPGEVRARVLERRERERIRFGL